MASSSLCGKKVIMVEVGVVVGDNNKQPTYILPHTIMAYKINNRWIMYIEVRANSSPGILKRTGEFRYFCKFY